MGEFLDIRKSANTGPRYFVMLGRPPNLLTVKHPIDLELLKKLYNYPIMVVVLVIIMLNQLLYNQFIQSEAFEQI
jgi:hypothetical protein